MPLEVGSRLAHYDVTALIGEGGMGQVYQATDTKLNRQVALKVLPQAFTEDPDRFTRRAESGSRMTRIRHTGRTVALCVALSVVSPSMALGECAIHRRGGGRAALGDPGGGAPGPWPRRGVDVRRPRGVVPRRLRGTSPAHIEYGARPRREPAGNVRRAAGDGDHARRDSGVSADAPRGGGGGRDG